MQLQQFAVQIGDKSGPVDALLLRPDDMHTLFVFAHGAGAGMRHAFMQSLSEMLYAVGVGTLRYQFPYMQQGGRRPDPPGLLEATVRAAIAIGHELAAGATLVAGGKSMGGRMTSQALAKQQDARVAGIVFVGFPLHQPNRPAMARAEHLASVQVPMLFLQGTRDTLADIDLIRQVHAGIADRATLHIIDGADHSFSVLKRSGRTNEEVQRELAQVVSSWVREL